MNLKWLPALALATQLHASTIDLPQDSQIWQQKNYTTTLQFFDEFEQDGWVSLYGVLNGGTLFNTDLSTLTWNFGDSNYHLNYIVINDGQDSCKLVSLTNLDMFQGDLTLTAFDNAPVQRIDLYGHLGLPDKTPTLGLLFLALLTLFYYDKKAVS